MIYANTLCENFAMSEMGERLKEARLSAGFKSAMSAAKRHGWAPSTYGAHENGQNDFDFGTAERYGKAFKVTPTWLMAGDEAAPRRRDEVPSFSRTEVPLMGYVGAGAIVEPEFEQVPPDGFDTVTLPFAVPEGIIALGIRGESMRPAYRDGDAVLVYEDQRYATDDYLGEEAVVRTAEGRRYLKELQRGSKRGLYNLYSHNDRLIEDRRVEWVGEIYVTVRANQLRRIASQRRAAATRRRRALGAQTDGMEELDL